LNYHEAYNTYQEYNNIKEQGVCLNNIGSIFMKRKEYDKAETYFTRAADV
jgi:Tfp pilus assembly protein PilF